MPPTGSGPTRLGNAARQAFTTGGGIISAGKSLRKVAPAPRAAKAEFAAGGGDERAEVGGNDQPATGGLHLSHLLGTQYRSRADDGVGAVSLGGAANAHEGVGAVERDLQNAEFSADQPADRRLGLVRVMPLRMATSGQAAIAWVQDCS